MSKARQSKRQRYRKPRADYQAGGRVNARTGGGGSQRFTEYDAVMPKGGKKIPKKFYYFSFEQSISLEKKIKFSRQTKYTYHFEPSWCK